MCQTIIWAFVNRCQNIIWAFVNRCQNIIWAFKNFVKILPCSNGHSKSAV